MMSNIATCYGGSWSNYIGHYSGPNTIFGGAGNDTLEGFTDNDLYSGSDVLAGGTGDDTLFGGGESDLYIFTFYGDRRDYIYDSSGSYDELRINGVSNLSGLQFFRATAFGASNDYNDLVIRRAGDTAMSEYIVVDDYWSGSAAGAGRIEYLTVNGSNYWFNDVTSSL